MDLELIIPTKQFHLTPSDEQQVILNHVATGINIVGDCVAGSGKTTSILLLAEAFPHKHILQITYNKALKAEVRNKSRELGLTNINVHSYHSLGFKYYNSHTDESMEYALEHDIAPIQKIRRFDIIIIDEAQDMSLLYYFLLKKFIADSYTKPQQLIVLGDRYQGVYHHKGTDSRFLTLCHELWNRPFTSVSLSVSYRLTHAISDFVNEVMLGQPRIQAVKPGPKVSYLVCDTFKIQHDLAKYIQKQLSENHLKPDDIFVLASSIKNDRVPIKHLENELTKLGIPLYYPTSDETVLDSKILRGKVVFSTFNQAKGRERKLVILYGFDRSYFKFYEKTESPFVCPDKLYVAATRAKERLIVIHHYTQKPLPFLKKSMAELATTPYVWFQTNGLASMDKKMKREARSTCPTSLVQHLKEHHVTTLNKRIKELFITEQEVCQFITIPSTVDFGATYEDVSDITGVAIPAMYEAKERGMSTIETALAQKYAYAQTNKRHTYLQEAYTRHDKSLVTMEDYLRLATLYISFNEEIYHKISQISTYTWLTEEMVNQCFNTLRKYIQPVSVYEHPIYYDCKTYREYGDIHIAGTMDSVDTSTVLELKCVQNLMLEHKLQVLIYAWMWNKTHKSLLGPRIFKLVNMISGECVVLQEKLELMEQVMAILFENKYAPVDEKTDEEFIEACKKPKYVKARGKRCIIVEDD